MPRRLRARLRSAGRGCGIKRERTSRGLFRTGERSTSSAKRRADHPIPRLRVLPTSPASFSVRAAALAASSRSVGRAGQAPVLEALVDLGARDAEQFGGLPLVVARDLQRLEDRFALELLQRAHDARGSDRCACSAGVRVATLAGIDAV